MASYVRPLAASGRFQHRIALGTGYALSYLTCAVLLICVMMSGIIAVMTLLVWELDAFFKTLAVFIMSVTLFCLFAVITTKLKDKKTYWHEYVPYGTVVSHHTSKGGTYYMPTIDYWVTVEGNTRSGERRTYSFLVSEETWSSPAYAVGSSLRTPEMPQP